jgi:hypothetical protein
MSSTELKNRYENQYLMAKNKMNFKDKNGNIFNLDKNDPRVLSGELIPFRKGSKNPNSFYKKLEKQTYVLKSPTGEIIKIRTMKKFARENDFVPMFRVGRKSNGWELIEKIVD